MRLTPYFRDGEMGFFILDWVPFRIEVMINVTILKFRQISVFGKLCGEFSYVVSSIWIPPYNSHIFHREKILIIYLIPYHCWDSMRSASDKNQSIVF